MKIFRFMMAAVLMLGTVACSKSDIKEAVGNEEVTMTLSVALEDLGTRATTAGTAKQITNVKFGIYDVNAGGKYLPISGDVAFDQTTGKAEIEVTLFTGKTYDLVFWAYNAANTSAYTVDMPNRTITVNYGQAANDESRDAFFHIENGFVAGPSKTFILKRPFAQLNAGQNKADLEAMAATSNRIVSSTLKTKAYNTLSLVNGNASNLVDVEFTNAYVIDGETITVKVDGKDEEFKSISMNYLLLDESKETVDVEFSFFGDEGTEFVRKYSYVPVQRNYRTNILGQLISAPSVFTILIDPIFTGDHNSFVEYPEDGTLEALIEPLLDQKEATIVLSSDVTYTTGAQIGSTPLIPEGSALKNLTIEGGVVSRADAQPVITFIGDGVGSVRAANGGTITFRNVKIVDQSVSYAEQNWEYGYLEFAGNLVFEKCTFVNAAMFEGENATFTSCYFNSNNEGEYAAWVSNGVASFNKCVFEGWRGLKTHEAYGSEVATITVDDCDFTLTKKPGFVIGTVNADTTISITNSTFDTPAGDQGLHIYETDTDVTTFNFVEQNNTVSKVVTTDEELATAIKTDTKNLVIVLAADLNLASGNSNVFGGANTEVLTIKGMTGLETLNFTTKYMPTMNCAGKLVVKDLNITRVAPSANTWNVRDLMLRTNTEFENVVLEKGVAVCDGIDCKFTNVTFAESGDYYALWIEAVGANVELVDCTVNSVGRGIKIDEQYVKEDDKALVNLTVSGTTFETNNKAAVLVKSAAGANIIWGEGNDIANVAADSTNAVWVDVDAADTYDLVTVDGCTKIVEGAPTGVLYDEKTKTHTAFTAEGLALLATTPIKAYENIALGADIDLAGVDFAGLYAFNPETPNTFDGQGHTVKNLKKLNAGNDYGFIRQWCGPIKNVTIEGAQISGGGRIAILAGKPYSNIENCHLKNCTLTSNYWACGGLAGLYNSGSVSNCTAENVTVSCSQGVGILIGCVNETPGARNFTDCKVTNCSIINWGGSDAYGAAALAGMYNIDGTSTSLIKGCQVTGLTINGVESDALYGAANGTVVTVE